MAGEFHFVTAYAGLAGLIAQRARERVVPTGGGLLGSGGRHGPAELLQLLRISGPPRYPDIGNLELGNVAEHDLQDVHKIPSP